MTTNTRTLEARRAARAEREAFRAQRLARQDWDKMIARRWEDAAACDGADPRLFDVTDADQAAEAGSLCARCDVVQQCRAQAEGDRQFEGVAGGQVFKWTKIPVLVDGKIRQRDTRTVTPIISAEGSVAA